jgi:hypothetical protein
MAEADKDSAISDVARRTLSLYMPCIINPLLFVFILITYRQIPRPSLPPCWSHRYNLGLLLEHTRPRSFWSLRLWLRIPLCLPLSNGSRTRSRAQGHRIRLPRITFCVQWLFFLGRSRGCRSGRRSSGTGSGVRSEDRFNLCDFLGEVLGFVGPGADSDVGLDAEDAVAVEEGVGLAD